MNAQECDATMHHQGTTAGHPKKNSYSSGSLFSCNLHTPATSKAQ